MFKQTSDPVAAGAGRLVVVGQVYQQAPGEDPVHLDLGYSRQLRDGEQVYQRRVVLQEGPPVPLDPGWVERASLLVVQHSRPVREVYPTPEEAKADSERRVVLSVGGVPVGSPPAGECVVISSPGSLREMTLLVSGSGPARLLVTVVPE